MKKPRLRDSRHLCPDTYEINSIPETIVVRIGGSIVFLLYTGRTDLTGNDWGNIFADAIGGTHLASPIGIADVFRNRTAWSLKTVKNKNPFSAREVRLISGRCSPDYSYGIMDPHSDIQKTGEAVLAIWNSRVDIALSHYISVRVGVLIRDDNLSEFTLFEEYLEHFNLSDFIWKENKNGNLEGYNKISGKKSFIWQPHGSQFTILCRVPENAIRFRLKHPETISEAEVLQSLKYNPEWIEFIQND